MRMQEHSSEKWGKVKRFGELLTKLSALLFAVAIPTSIALDNVAAGIGIVGLLLLLFTKNLPLPPVKHLILLLLAEIPHYITTPKKIFKSTHLKQYLAAYFVGFKTGLSRDFLKKVAILLGISTIILVLSLIFEAFTGQNVKHINFSKLHLLKGLYFRPKGLLNHPLTTGGVLFTLTFFFGALYAYYKEKKFLVFSLIALSGVVVNQSRSYWIGVFIFLLFFSTGALIKKNTRKLAVIGLALILGTSVVVTTVPQFKNRLKSITDIRHNWSNKDRLAIWLSYYYAFKRDYGTAIIYGKGEEAKKVALSYGKEACLKFYSEKHCKKQNYLRRLHGANTHNIYLKFLSKYGIIGLLAYLFFWGFNIYKNLIFFMRRNELFALIFASGYIGFLAAGFFENNFTDAEVLTAILFTLGVNFALLSQYSAEKSPYQKAD